MSVTQPQAPTAHLGFQRVGAAAPTTVVAWRREFASWLHRKLDLDDERRSDVVLAVDEALSNAAEFAYAGTAGGDVTLNVTYTPCDARLDIEVADDGTWRETDPQAQSLSRGRGITLMRALSDYFTLDKRSDGTRVLMSFEGCRGVVAESA